MSMEHYDTIVLGGGPAGMMAAGTLGKRGKRVLLLEKNRILGKKLNITGGGRCNVTNAEFDIRKLLPHYGDAEQYLYSPFSQFGVNDTFQFFEDAGLPLVVEAGKRAFPHTQSAPDVTKVMKGYAAQPGVTLRTGTRAQGFIVQEGKIIGVKTNSGDFTAETFVLATGGMSHQETGSTGEGIVWLNDLGHTVHDPNPDIVPLTSEDTWIHMLSGTTASFVRITFSDMQNSPKSRFSRTGKILFTHFGLSGPLILNSTKNVKKLLKGGHARAYIDLFPDTEVGTVRNRVLGVFEANKNKTLKNVIQEIAPHGMGKAVLSLFSPELAETKVHSVTKEDRTRLADIMKAMPLTVTGTMGYDWAIVSDGGVDLEEIDMKTMRSKRHGNLFVTGDALHITRPSGGYSLQLCWTTGFVAGKNA
jgi:predicted Rossmann fold flavoprotein